MKRIVLFVVGMYGIIQAMEKEMQTVIKDLGNAVNVPAVMEKLELYAGPKNDDTQLKKDDSQVKKDESKNSSKGKEASSILSENSANEILKKLDDLMQRQDNLEKGMQNITTTAGVTTPRREGRGITLTSADVDEVKKQKEKRLSVVDPLDLSNLPSSDSQAIQTNAETLSAKDQAQHAIELHFGTAAVKSRQNLIPHVEEAIRKRSEGAMAETYKKPLEALQSSARSSKSARATSDNKTRSVAPATSTAVNTAPLAVPTTIQGFENPAFIQELINEATDAYNSKQTWIQRLLGIAAVVLPVIVGGISAAITATTKTCPSTGS